MWKMAADKSCSLVRGNAEGHSLFCDMGNFTFKEGEGGKLHNCSQGFAGVEINAEYKRYKRQIAD